MNKETSQKCSYSFCLFTLFLSVFKSTHSCFKNQDILCVYMTHTHTKPTTILSYSFSHSVELPLGLLGLFYIYITYLKKTFTHFRYSYGWHDVYCAKAVPAHFFEVLMFPVCFFLFCLSPRQRTSTTVYTNQTHMVTFTKSIFNYPEKLPIPKYNPAAA